MKKFFVLFCLPREAVDAWVATVDESTRNEQTQKLMSEWATWMTDHESMILDKGLPLGKTKRVTSEGITDVRNDLNWYLLVEGESHEAVAEIFKAHPHLQIPSAYVEIVDASRSPM